MKNPYKNQIKIEFDAVSQNEALARVIICGFLMELHPTVEELCDVKTALSEAVTNSIVHGYKDQSGKIKLICRIYNDKELYISVTDFGRGIEDISKAREPMFTTDRESERSGMGFTIMETFMDEFKVTSRVGKWTRIVMRKKIA
ncbi:MAG TPA: anti-sigma F factor [Clostridiales bacterium]|nr:anti-sigma F factor [Clostridiales bacterium]